MERRPPSGGYINDGHNEDSRRNNVTPNVPHQGSLPSMPSGNVQFCDGLIHGLDNLPPITAGGASSSVYTPPWTSDTTLPSSFGGWTSYPTDDSGISQFSPEPVSSPGSSSLGFLSTDDYFRSLSQPDSTSSTESGLYNTSRVRSHSEHFDVFGGMAGVDFSSLARGGQDLYADSMEKWMKKPYDPFGTAHLLQQQTDVPVSIPTPNYTTPVDKPQSHHATVAPESTDPVVKNKPSYSEVAKNKPQEFKAKKTESSTPSHQDGNNTHSKSEGFPDFTGIKLHKNYSRPRQSKSYKPKKRPVLEPTNIKPDSRYGLDTFEEAIPSKSCLSDHLSVSSGSTPQSRKGSSCSENGSYCGMDDLEPIDVLKKPSSGEEAASAAENPSQGHPWTDLKFDNPKSSNANKSHQEYSVDGRIINLGTHGSQQTEDTKPSGSSMRSDDGKRKTEAERVDAVESKRSRASDGSASAGNGRNKQSSAKQPVFFDPKRIFASSMKPEPPSKPRGSEYQRPDDGPESCIPNNQQPSSSAHQPPSQNHQTPKPKPSMDAENILNNDKPKTKQNSNINRSCYINNNLRDSTSSSSKKQTNADAQRDSCPAPGQTSNDSGQTTSTSSQSHLGRGGNHPRHRSGTARGSSRGSGRGSGPGRPDGRGSGGPRTQARGLAPSRTNPRGASASRTESHSTSRTEHHSTADERPSREELPPRRKIGERRNPREWDQQPFFGDLLIQLWKWILWGSQELGSVVWNITKLTISIGLALLLMVGQYGLSTVKSIWVVIHARFFTTAGSKTSPEEMIKKARTPCGLKENIALPSTGDEAMKRLLAGKGKDPYSILGVKADVSDDVIKKYYRKQAVLVHPDKNQTPGAEEAFKILGHAFDLIGEPEKRKLFDSQRLEAQEEEEAMHQFADLLSKLHERMQEASNLMRCENCGGKHRRVPTERPMYAARYCQKCDYCHPVREGDVWAESHMLGFLWNYYACMENRVFDITEWASCQCDRLKHIQANAHQIVYRIATNGNRHTRQNNNRSNEADIEDLLNHLFHHNTGGGASSQSGTPDQGTEGFGQYGRQTSSAWNQSASSGGGKKNRRKKKKVPTATLR